MAKSGKQWLVGAATGGIGGFFMGDKKQPPKIPILPPPIEQIDLQSMEEYTRKKAKERKGRSSTILASKLGVSGNGKTILG